MQLLLKFCFLVVFSFRKSDAEHLNQNPFVNSWCIIIIIIILVADDLLLYELLLV